MSKTAQELINEWGAKKYPQHAGKKFTFEVDQEYASGCPTCGDDGYPYVAVLAASREVDRLRFLGIHDVILDVLKESEFTGVKRDE